MVKWGRGGPSDRLVIHPKSKQIGGDLLLSTENLAEKVLISGRDDKLLRQKCINHENIMDVLMAREPILPFRTIRRLLMNNSREIIFREAEPRLFAKVFKYSCLCLPWLQVFMAPPSKLCSGNYFQLQAK